MEIAQINARIDARDKREGDAALARLGVSATDAIRALWSYLAQAQSLPAFMGELAPEGQTTHEGGTSARRADSRRGAGLALSLAREKGLDTGAENINDISYDELRDLALDELAAEGAFRV